MRSGPTLLSFSVKANESELQSEGTQLLNATTMMTAIFGNRMFATTFRGQFCGPLTDNGKWQILSLSLSTPFFCYVSDN